MVVVGKFRNLIDKIAEEGCDCTHVHGWLFELLHGWGTVGGTVRDKALNEAKTIYGDTAKLRILIGTDTPVTNSEEIVYQAIAAGNYIRDDGKYSITDYFQFEFDLPFSPIRPAP